MDQWLWVRLHWHTVVKGYVLRLLAQDGRPLPAATATLVMEVRAVLAGAEAADLLSSPAPITSLGRGAGPIDIETKGERDQERLRCGLWFYLCGPLPRPAPSAFIRVVARVDALRAAQPLRSRRDFPRRSLTLAPHRGVSAFGPEPPSAVLADCARVAGGSPVERLSV